MSEDAGARLHAALRAAYAPHLERVLAERGFEMSSGLAAAIEEGRAWLDEALGSLLRLPFREQARGPLEVFQEAMRFPTAALRVGGARAPSRDPAASEALPGDLYDLAPASSQALGAEVWEAHLAWGVAKARAFRPSVGLLSRDLMDRSRIEPAVESAGFRLLTWPDVPDAGAFGRLAVAFVDLAHEEADAGIRALAGGGVRVIGFGPHVDDLAMVRARALGAADALPRSVFFRTVADLLPRPV